ncbi:hypothetical protein KY331_00600 [Candidatus Woesearchaeota archaeon]|nr:hypothetical protein [Candidatus Woesearchaeota archaeon]
MIPWILISIAVLLLLFAVVAILIRKKHKTPPDYYNLFIIGMMWVVIGIPLKNHVLWSMGFVFMIAGLVNKKDWKKNKRRWKDMDKDERLISIIVTILLGVLVLLGFVVLLLTKYKII